MTETSCISMTGNQKRLLEEIVLAVAGLPDAPVRDIVRGNHMLAITSARTGLCTRMERHGQHVREEAPPVPESARELSSFLVAPPPNFPDAVSYAMAAINSLLPVPERMVPLKAQDLIRKQGEGKNVAVIGHFSFVEKMGGEFRNLWVLEMHPRPGDLPAEAAAELLPLADLVALTATTLLNGTCANILGLIHREAFTIMLGPSTPFVPCLFDWGINALAGCHVVNTSLVASCVREGRPFKHLRGVEPLIWTCETNSIPARR